jgi:serine/threonine-protein kinase
LPALEQLSGPTAFGKYTLLAKLATGGMGEVFLARSTADADAAFQKLLVIKRLLAHLNDQEQFVDMFLDEARLAAQLHHPNICQIYELGKVTSDHYMAMEYVEGIQLATLLRGRGRSPTLSDPRLTCALLSQACEALHYAHNLRMGDGSLAGVVHRDVNPKNIMVTSAGTVKVLDFGVAKARGQASLSKSGTLKGTYSYMSPEQLRGDGLDRRSDIFSLGTIAWEAVTGRRLFKRPTDQEVWRAIAEKPIPRASALADNVSAELDNAIAKALSRDREDRYSTARELALALEESLSSYGSPLSTVAIAAEVDRCFGRELEELRSVVMKAQRLRELDDDDDEFDGPTRLFDDGNLQEKIAELRERRPTKPDSPNLASLQAAVRASSPALEESDSGLEATPSAAGAARSERLASPDLGAPATAGEESGAAPGTPTADAERPVERPPPPAFPESPAHRRAASFADEQPTLPGRDRRRARAAAAAAGDSAGPSQQEAPEPEPFEGSAGGDSVDLDMDVRRSNARLVRLLLFLIVILGLAVVGHYVWSQTLGAADASAAVEGP